MDLTVIDDIDLEIAEAEFVNPERAHAHLPRPGQSGMVSPRGNPEQRGRRTRQKLSNMFMEGLVANFEVYGPEAIEMCRRTDPAAYLRIIASLIPKELKINEGSSAIDSLLDQYSDAQLAAVIDAVATASASEEGENTQVAALPGIQSNSLY